MAETMEEIKRREILMRAGAVLLHERLGSPAGGVVAIPLSEMPAGEVLNMPCVVLDEPEIGDLFCRVARQPVGENVEVSMDGSWRFVPVSRVYVIRAKYRS